MSKPAGNQGTPQAAAQIAVLKEKLEANIPNEFKEQGARVSDAVVSYSSVAPKSTTNYVAEAVKKWDPTTGPTEAQFAEDMANAELHSEGGMDAVNKAASAKKDLATLTAAKDAFAKSDTSPSDLVKHYNEAAALSETSLGKKLEDIAPMEEQMLEAQTNAQLAIKQAGPDVLRTDDVDKLLSGQSDEQRVAILDTISKASTGKDAEVVALKEYVDHLKSEIPKHDDLLKPLTSVNAKLSEMGTVLKGDAVTKKLAGEVQQFEDSVAKHKATFKEVAAAHQIKPPKDFKYEADIARAKAQQVKERDAQVTKVAQQDSVISNAQKAAKEASEAREDALDLRERYLNNKPDLRAALVQQREENERATQAGVTAHDFLEDYAQHSPRHAEELNDYREFQKYVDEQESYMKQNAEDVIKAMQVKHGPNLTVAEYDQALSGLPRQAQYMALDKLEADHKDKRARVDIMPGSSVDINEYEAKIAAQKEVDAIVGNDSLSAQKRQAAQAQVDALPGLDPRHVRAKTEAQKKVDEMETDDVKVRAARQKAIKAAEAKGLKSGHQEYDAAAAMPKDGVEALAEKRYAQAQVDALPGISDQEYQAYQAAKSVVNAQAADIQKSMPERRICADYGIPFTPESRSISERNVVKAALKSHELTKERQELEQKSGTNRKAAEKELAALAVKEKAVNKELEAAVSVLSNQRAVKEREAAAMAASVTGVPLTLAATEAADKVQKLAEGKTLLDEMTKAHGGSWSFSARLSEEARTKVLAQSARDKRIQVGMHTAKAKLADDQRIKPGGSVLQDDPQVAAVMLQDSARRMGDFCDAVGEDLKESRTTMNALSDRIKDTEAGIEEAARKEAVKKILDSGNPTHDPSDPKAMDKFYAAVEKETKESMKQYNSDIRELNALSVFSKDNVTKMHDAHSKMLDVNYGKVNAIQDKLEINQAAQAALEAHVPRTEKEFEELSPQDKVKAVVQYAKASMAAGEGALEQEVQESLPKKEQAELKAFEYKMTLGKKAVLQQEAHEEYAKIAQAHMESPNPDGLKRAEEKLISAKTAYMKELNGMSQAQADQMAALTEGKDARKAEIEKAARLKWPRIGGLVAKINKFRDTKLKALRKEQKGLEKEMVTVAKGMDDIVKPYLTARADFQEQSQKVEETLQRVEAKRKSLTPGQRLDAVEQAVVDDAQQRVNAQIDRQAQQLVDVGLAENTPQVKAPSAGALKRRFDPKKMAASFGVAAGGGSSVNSSSGRSPQPPRKRTQRGL